jgi:glycosyltransferase involved in cell wall biosynthesis
MKKALLKTAEELGVAHAVFIKSGMSFEDIAQHYRSADLVVYPSYYEGQGLIPLEALASGTPVVTVDQPPLTEMVDDTVGGLFDRGDYSGMAKVVCDELNGSVLRLKKAKAGRKRVLEAFTCEGNAELYEDVFQRSVQKRHWRDK